jgi:hypothetical protein
MLQVMELKAVVIIDGRKNHSLFLNYYLIKVQGTLIRE